jgi:DNA-binding transcriptional ArsR family regulator
MIFDHVASEIKQWTFNYDLIRKRFIAQANACAIGETRVCWAEIGANVCFSGPLTDVAERGKGSGGMVPQSFRGNSDRPNSVHEALKALAEPQRIAILRLVQARELPAGEIADHFNTTRQAISQHLRLLTNAGLITQRREGTRRLYRVRKEAFGELRTFLDIFWNDGLYSLKHQVENRNKGGRRGG